MLYGRGTEQTWSTLACALNVALLLAERGIYPEAEPMIKLAMDALMLVQKHAHVSGELALNLAHHHKQSILSAINMHDQQCAQCTKGQIAEVLQEIHRRITTGEILK
jgi:hypothetical protein